MATTVTSSFAEFSSKLNITNRQENLVAEKREKVVDAIKASLSLHPDESKLIGSYKRQTLIRYLFENDVDVMIILSYGDNKGWDNSEGTIKALDKFKSILEEKFPTVNMRRDRNCITMQYPEFRLDVVPAFACDGDFYQIPDSIRKVWVFTDPIKFASYITQVNTNMDGRFIPLIKMVKGWNRHVDYPIRSFHLECILYNRYKTYFQAYSYSSMLKFFFENLPEYLMGPIYDPVMGDRVDTYLDNTASKTKRQIAIEIAQEAKSVSRRAYENEGSSQYEAIKLWKSIMGDFFPSYG